MLYSKMIFLNTKAEYNDFSKVEGKATRSEGRYVQWLLETHYVEDSMNKFKRKINEGEG